MNDDSVFNSEGEADIGDLTLESILSTHGGMSADCSDSEDVGEDSPTQLRASVSRLHAEKKAMQLELLCAEGTVNRFRELDERGARESEALTAQLFESEMRYREREVSVKSMVDEMEELHENLVELDGRFERSEDANRALRGEKEITVRELSSKCTQLEEKVSEAEIELAASREELKKARAETQAAQRDATARMSKVREGVATAVAPVEGYVTQNKGSRSPLKKLKCWRLVKQVNGRLQGVLKDME